MIEAENDVPHGTAGGEYHVGGVLLRRKGSTVLPEDGPRGVTRAPAVQPARSKAQDPVGFVVCQDDSSIGVVDYRANLKVLEQERRKAFVVPRLFHDLCL
jgi:hypothetical protein